MFTKGKVLFLTSQPTLSKSQREKLNLRRNVIRLLLRQDDGWVREKMVWKNSKMDGSMKKI